MPSVSFIVSTYNVGAFIEQTLTSLFDAVDAAGIGDYEVLIVDDGSSDDTVQAIDALCDELDDDVSDRVLVVALGANTYGGVGIAANLGLERASRDVVFFVDGDDWLIPEGFAAAWRRYCRTTPDVLICRYFVFDSETQESTEPPEMDRWGKIAVEGGGPNGRSLALQLIGVPWRKFYYTRRFLNRGPFRFPEGDFFFEDNPFHWQTTLAASSVEFCRDEIAQHRVGRAGQTMASVGSELLAFFTHFETILDLCDTYNGRYRPEAFWWLINQMAWTEPAIALPYAADYGRAAARCLARATDQEWTESILPFVAGKELSWRVELLRAGQLTDYVNAFHLARMQAQLRDLRRELDQTKLVVKRLRSTEDRAAATAMYLRNRARAAAIFGPTSSSPANDS